MSYVGVRAEDAAGCALVDQPASERYAVITGATGRIGATVAGEGNNQPLVDGKATLEVGCPSQGKSIGIDIDIAMPTLERLVFNGGPPLVRCTPWPAHEKRGLPPPDRTKAAARPSRWPPSASSALILAPFFKAHVD